jgi:nucleotide-binding universal stress UspA family protein
VKDRHRLSLDAVDDFRRARRRAILQDLVAQLKGAPDDLLSFDEVRQKLKARARAWEYLQRRGVTASYVIEQPLVAKAILTTSESHRADVITMGGYSLRLELEIVLGNTVDHVHRVSQMPVLICSIRGSYRGSSASARGVPTTCS